MSDTPGKTDVIEHDIETGTAYPIRLPPYHLTHVYRDTVKKEIAEMLELDVTEPSTSEWSAPIVLVKKKDGTIRFCIDCRRLNGVSETDAYPMPRIDEHHHFGSDQRLLAGTPHQRSPDKVSFCNTLQTLPNSSNNLSATNGSGTTGTGRYLSFISRRRCHL